MISLSKVWFGAWQSAHHFVSRNKALVIVIVLLVSAIPVIATPKTAAEWYEQGNAQYQDGDIDAAMVSLRKAIELKKDYVEAFVLLGNSYLENGNFAKAVPALRRANELKANDYSILLAYSSALEGTGDKSAQIPVLGKLFGLNSTDLVVGIKYLSLIEQVGSEKFTKEYIEVLEALRKAPNPDQSYGPKLAKAYVANGDWGKAGDLYSELVKRSPDVAEYWVGLARSKAKTDIQAAKPAYEKAILVTESASERQTLKSEMDNLGAKPSESAPAAATIENVSAEKAVADKAAADKVAAEKAAADKAAADKALAAKLAADKAAAEKAAADKAAADKAAAEKLAAVKAAAEKAAADKAFAAKLAEEKAAAEKAAAEKAAAEKAAADKAAADKAAADKAAADKAAAEKLTAEKAAAEKAAAEKLAADKAAADKALAAKLASEKAAAEKAAADKAAADKAAAEKLAAEKAAADKAAADKALAAKLASEKAAAEKAAADKAAADKAAAEKLAAEKAAAEKAAADKAAAEKLAAEKAAAEKAAAEKAMAAKLAAEKRTKDSLEVVAKRRQDSLARVEKIRLDSLARAEKAMRDSIAKAELKYKQDLARLEAEEKARKEKAKQDSIQQAQADKRTRDSLARVAKFRADSIARAEKLRQDSVVKAEKMYRDSLAKAEKAYKDSVVRAEKAYRDSLIAAEKKAKAEAEKAAIRQKQMQDSIARAEKRYQDSVARAEKARSDSLARVEKQRADSLVRVEKARMDSMARVEKMRVDSIAKAEALARLKAQKDSIARAEEEKRIRIEAERKAKEEADRLAKAEAERKAKERLDSLARVEEERKQREAMEKVFQSELEAVLTAKRIKMDTLSVLAKIQEKRIGSKNPDSKWFEAEGILAARQWNFSASVESFKKAKSLGEVGNRLYALALSEQGDHGNAIKQFAKVSNVREERDIWMHYIKSLIATKQSATVANEYEALLAADPKNEEALLWLIEYYRKPLQKEKLQPKLEIQLAKNPTDGMILNELVTLTDKESPKAIEYRERYIKVNPDDVKAKADLAALYEAKGKTDAAIKLYVEIAPNYASDKAFNLKLGQLLIGAKKPLDAIGYYETVVNMDGGNKKLIVQVAELHETVKQPERALEFYNRALVLDPKDGAVQAKVSQLASGKGKDAQREALLRIVQGDPSAHEVLFQLAKMALADKDKDQAYGYLSKALKLKPDNGAYLALLPEVLSSTEQAVEQLVPLEKIASQPNVKPEVVLLVANALASKKNFASAATWYERVYLASSKLLDGNRDAILSLDAAKKSELAGLLAGKYLKNNATDKEIRKIQIDALANDPKAEKSYREALMAYLSVDPDGASKHLLKLSVLDLSAKDTSSAITHTKAWVNKNPKDLSGLRLLAALLKGRKGEEESYLATITTISALDPASKGRYEIEMADIRFARGDYEDANQLLESALKREDGNASLWFRGGVVAEKLRKDDLAKSRFGKAFGLSPTNSEYAHAYAKYLVTDSDLKANGSLWKFLLTQKPSDEEQRKIAKSNYLNGDFIGAARIWDELVKSNPSLKTGEPMVVDSYLKSGQTAKGRAIIEEKVQQNPNDVKLQEQLAQLYKEEGNEKGFAKSLEALVKLDPNLKNYQLQLAREKEKAKEYPEALANYDAWVSRHDNDMEALTAMRNLADKQKDTTRLLEALTRLTRQKSVANEYSRQMAELDYIRSGSVIGVEKQLKTDKNWKEGQLIVVGEYLKKGEKAKLLPYLDFLTSQNDPKYYEPLGDIYAQQKKADPANANYLKAVKANPKDKELFEKAYRYSVETKSATSGELLKMGVTQFEDDEKLKLAYAKSLGQTQQALDVYSQIIVKNPRVETLESGISVAEALNNYSVALNWLDKWAGQDAGNVKVWEKTHALAVRANQKSKSIEALERLNQLKPENKDFAIALAKSYEEQNQAGKALEAYKRVLGLDPKNRQVLVRFIGLATSQNKLSEEKDVFLQVEQADPTAHEAQFQLAKLFLKDGDKERAYGYLSKALKNDPSNQSYQSLLPEVVVTEGQIVDHLAVFERLAATPGSSAKIQLLAAKGNMAKNNPVGAARWYSEIYLKEKALLEGQKDPISSLYSVKKYPFAIDLANAYLAKEPRDGAVLKMLIASLRANNSSPAEIRKALTSLVEVDANAASNEMLNLAKLDLASRDSAAALAHAKSWIAVHPKDLDGYEFVYPLVRKKNGEEETYLKTLQSLKSLDAKSKGKYDIELASLYFKRGDYEDAQALLLQGVKNNPKDAALWFQLAETEMKLRKEDLAKQHFAKAYELATTQLTYAKAYGDMVSKDAEIKETLSLWRFLSTRNPTEDEKKKYAKSLFLNGDFIGSAAQWDYFMKSQPQIGMSEPMVAESYLRSGQTAKARLLYEEKLKATPDNLPLLEQVALLYQKEANAKGYLSTLENIVKVDPKYKNYQLALAQEKAKNRDYTGALEAYDAYVSRNEGDVNALQAMEQISEMQKDTTRLMTALTRLTRLKNADPDSKRKLAEIDYVKNGNLVGVERLVAVDKKWSKGKSILVRAYMKKGQTAKLAPFSEFMQAESRQNPELLEPLGDLYALQRKALPANNAYIQALRAEPKDRALFDKVWDYAKTSKSPFLPEILKSGYTHFNDDMKIKRAYADQLGKTPSALAVYEDILNKESDVGTLRKAVEVAVAVQRWPLALTWVDKWSQLDPKDEAVWKTMLEGGEKNGNRDLQRKALNGWLLNAPRTGEKNLLRLAQLDLAAKDTAAAIDHGKKWNALNPKDLNGLQFLYPLVKSGPGEKAVYLKVLEGLIVLDKKSAGRYDLELSALYFERGDFEDAHKILSQAIGKNSKDAALWYRLGEIEVKLRRENTATDKFRKAYELAPTQLTYARTLGERLNKDSELKPTLSLWRYLSTQNPSFDERKKLAKSLFLNNDYMASAMQWDWFVKADPAIGQTEPMISQAYLLSGQTAKARAIFEARLKNDPNNIALLEEVANLYQKEGNTKGYLELVGRIVQVDPKHKNFQLILAQEKEKVRDFTGALDAYDAWVSRNGGDVFALKKMRDLSDNQKDTTRLLEALVRLNRLPKVEPAYAMQIAHIDYIRSGNIAGVERILKKNGNWTEGKLLVIRHYAKQGNLGKLVSYTPFLSQLAMKDKSYSETLGDLYAFQKKKPQANSAYLDAVMHDKKDRGLFEKVYKYAKANASAYTGTLLKLGYENYPDDIDIKYDYAMTLGKNPKALELFQEIVNKDKSRTAALKNAAEIAYALRKTETAISLLQDWTKAEPKNPRPWNLLVELYTQTNKFDKLAGAQGELSNLSPKDAGLAFTAGLAYKKIKDKERALDFFNAAAALSPKNAVYAKEHGLALFDVGQKDRAKEPLLKADKSIKKDMDIQLALYQIYLAEKNKPLARERLQAVVAMSPMNKDYAYDLARLESELNSPKGVIEILERPFIKSGLDAEMSFMLLDAYFKTGQKARAALWAPTLLQKFPTESRSSLPLGILFYETKNKPKAKEILEAFTQRQGSEEGSYYLGKIYYEERNWMKTIDALNQAGEFHPEIPVMLGDAYIKSNQPEKAIGVYEKLYSKTKENSILFDLYSLYKKTNNKPGTIQILERILKVQPTNLDYRVELAELYRQKGDTKLAETQFEQILKSAPTHPGANLFMGMALAERREYGRAVKMLEIGTARYPDSLRAWKLIALAYRSQKNGAQSLKAYKRVLKDEPKNLDAAVAKMELTEELNLRSDLPEAYSHVVALDSNNFKAASSLAGIRYEDKRYNDAAALYSRVMDKLGNDRQAWANYGISLLEIKNVSKAKSVLQRAFELGAKDMKILTSLARIYKEEGNVEKAENLLTEMVKKDPRNHMAWYELGRIAADRNQNGVAETNFKKALQLAPATSEYSEALAHIYFEKEDYSGVMQYLMPVRSKLSPFGRNLYAESLMKQGKTDAALAEYNSVYAEQKSAPVLAKIAEIKVARGENREAMELIETSGFSNDSSVQLSLARAYVAQGEGDKARSVLNNLIRNSKYNAALYHLRGMSYYSENNCKKATKDFDQALKYNPDYMEAVYYTGVCLLKEGRDQDAQNYFKELSQHNSAQWMAKGFMGMGLVFEGQKKIEAAENYLQKATTAYDDAEAFAHLSRVYMKRRKLADAERTARKALAIKQDEPLALGTLGEILVAQNRKNEALALTKKALADHPHSCPLLVSSVKINYSSGNYDTARQSGLYAITECPDEYLPYLYVGLVADKKYNKKEAKENFKKFLKAGGDENLIPSEYR